MRYIVIVWDYGSDVWTLIWHGTDLQDAYRVYEGCTYAKVKLIRVDKNSVIQERGP